jgi:hypothetical protein
LTLNSGGLPFFDSRQRLLSAKNSVEYRKPLTNALDDGIGQASEQRADKGASGQKGGHESVDVHRPVPQRIAIVAGRARRHTEQMKRFVLDQPLVHLAVLLTGMARSAGIVADGHPVLIRQRLSQALIAEMPGISRQWASTLIRDLVYDGLVQWRYGRVKVLDFARLRAIAELGGWESLMPPSASPTQGVLLGDAARSRAKPSGINATPAMYSST